MDSNAKMDGGDVIRLHDIFYVVKLAETTMLELLIKKFLDRFGQELRVVNIPGNARILPAFQALDR